MVVLQSFFVVIFLSIFPSASTYMNVSKVRLLTNDSFDVNKGKPYSSSSAPKTVYNISSRLSICCHVQVARKQGTCLTNDTKTDKVSRINIKIDGHIDQREVLERNFDLLIGDPCDFDWMVPTMLDNFFVMKDGSITDADFPEGSLYDIEHYCLFRDPESDVYLARVCYPLLVRSGWGVFGVIITILITLTAFIVHSVIPEYKNLHGMMFRSYIGTYSFTAVAALAMEFTTESKTNTYLYSISDAAIRCGAGSCGCWLNAISFNIWFSIRSLRRIDSYTREFERRKYIYYAVYAWGTPVILLIAFLVPLYYLPYLGNEIPGYNVKLWGCVGGVTIIYAANAFFFISTARAIRHHKKDTSSMVNGVNRHDKINEEWFNLYVKLFICMGGHLVMWIIGLIKPTQTVVHILVTLEVIQAILVFVLFVWNDNIKRSIRERILTALTHTNCLGISKGNGKTMEELPPICD